MLGLGRLLTLLPAVRADTGAAPRGYQTAAPRQNKPHAIAVHNFIRATLFGDLVAEQLTPSAILHMARVLEQLQL